MTYDNLSKESSIDRRMCIIHYFLSTIRTGVNIFGEGYITLVLISVKEVFLMKEMNDNKYLEISTHLYVDQEGNTTNRVKFTLFNKNNEFVDAFDFNVDNSKIRFYGLHKEYNINNIPKYKKKLWNNYFDVFKQVEE